MKSEVLSAFSASYAISVKFLKIRYNFCENKKFSRIQNKVENESGQFQNSVAVKYVFVKQ